MKTWMGGAVAAILMVGPMGPAVAQDVVTEFEQRAKAEDRRMPELMALKERDPRAYEQEVQAMRARLQDRLQVLKVQNPDAYKQVRHALNARRKAWIAEHHTPEALKALERYRTHLEERLKETHRERYEDIMRRREEKKRHRLDAHRQHMEGHHEKATTHDEQRRIQEHRLDAQRQHMEGHYKKAQEGKVLHTPKHKTPPHDLKGQEGHKANVNGHKANGSGQSAPRHTGARRGGARGGGGHRR